MDRVAQRVPVVVGGEQRQRALAGRPAGRRQRELDARQLGGAQEGLAFGGAGGERVDDEVAPARVHPRHPHASTRRKWSLRRSMSSTGAWCSPPSWWRRRLAASSRSPTGPRETSSIATREARGSGSRAAREAAPAPGGGAGAPR